MNDLFWKTAAGFIFLLPLLFFALVMIKNRRSLWSGLAFFVLMVWLAGCSILIIAMALPWLEKHQVLLWILFFIISAAAVLILLLPVFLVGFYIIEGIRLIKREGFALTNLLSLGFAVFLIVYLFLWPFIAEAVNQGHPLLLMLFTAANIIAGYALSLLSIYLLSALLNQIHFGKRKRLDQIVVLGCGIFGERITPLLKSRVDLGIALLKKNPNAVLILSGGQGPGEDIPESIAMKRYALKQDVDPHRIYTDEKSVNTRENLIYSRELFLKENGRTAIATSGYHVFRSLLLAKSLGIKCIGYGAKTKWYFSLNAALREFAGYLSITKKKHLIILTFMILPVLLFGIINAVFG